MINILFEELPAAIGVSGRFYKIATDFRDWIAFFDMMSDTELEQKQKMLTALAWFSDEIPEDIVGAYTALTDFAACSGMKKNPENQKKSNSNSGVPTLSWLYDSAYVLGAFQQVYNIDLIRVKYMHWWEFSALFEALPEDTPIKKRIAYRQIRLSDIKDKERRKQILKIKRAVDFPHEPVSAQKIGEIFSM
ncbi:MAG: bacteriophage Gp15 family protein [Muribaculaceae bacterium]|nr:bacteriophage Gp15 family protein [Alistipes senegalensis]MCM1474260.1 bacteriophage Gp15 family protein [Muribaculaceae bacterium]